MLESIRDTGSISAAARDMGMCYKRAWLLLDSTNQAFTELVVTASPGGAGGGGATLTPFGAELLERYHRILDQAATMAADDLTALAKKHREFSHLIFGANLLIFGKLAQGSPAHLRLGQAGSGGAVIQTATKLAPRRRCPRGEAGLSPLHAYSFQLSAPKGSSFSSALASRQPG